MGKGEEGGIGEGGSWEGRRGSFLCGGVGGKRWQVGDGVRRLLISHDPRRNGEDKHACMGGQARVYGLGKETMGISCGFVIFYFLIK